MKVENEDFRVIYVDHPEQFTLATAVEYVFIQPLTATGTVQADISRTVPVGSIAVGRAVEIHARRADAVEAGRMLLQVQSADMSRTLSGYRNTGGQHFARLTHVWVVCDVYENDLRNIRVGETVEIRVSAYPYRVFAGRISDVGRVLEPTMRTAKVRIEVPNTGLMRVGMPVTATFRTHAHEKHAAVPATAILHFHDRDWVYVPNGDKAFLRVDVAPGKMLAGNMREVISGIQPGAQVIRNALVFQKTVEQ